MSKLTKRQINLATKIYALSILANCSGSAEPENQEEEAIHEKLAQAAQAKFYMMFPNDKNIPRNLTECIGLAKENN